MSWRLITIRVSHFNEARWALDRCGHAYDEEAYMPLLHHLGTVPVLLRHRAGAAEKYSTRFSTPVLVAGDRVLAASSEIVAFASEQDRDATRGLYFDPEARELEAHYGGRFAADTRAASIAASREMVQLLPEQMNDPAVIAALEERYDIWGGASPHRRALVSSVGARSLRRRSRPGRDSRGARVQASTLQTLRQHFTSCARIANARSFAS